MTTEELNGLLKQSCCAFQMGLMEANEIIASALKLSPTADELARALKASRTPNPADTPAATNPARGTLDHK